MARRFGGKTVNSPKSSEKSSSEFVFGGSFDPVHLGHLAIVEELQALAPELSIRIIPCAQQPLKDSPGASYSQREEMLRLALTSYQGWLIDNRENQRNGSSYTIETLQALNSENPQRRLIWVMGNDSAETLLKWHRYPELSGLCHLLTISRPQSDLPAVSKAITEAGFNQVASFNDLLHESNGLAYCHTMAEKPQSSTFVRYALAKDMALDSMLPQSVIEYIKGHGLYLNPKK